MGQQTTWEYFGLPADMDGPQVVAATASRNGHKSVAVAPRRRGWRRRGRVEASARDRAVVWLRNAMIALAGLAIAAAVVSFAAQYHMVLEYRGVRGDRRA